VWEAPVRGCPALQEEGRPHGLRVEVAVRSSKTGSVVDCGLPGKHGLFLCRRRGEPAPGSPAASPGGGTLKPPITLVPATTPRACDLLFRRSFQHFLKGLATKAGEVTVPGARERLAAPRSSRPSAVPGLARLLCRPGPVKSNLPC